MQQNLPRITPSSPPKSCASIPVRPKVKSSDQIANAPKNEEEEEKKSETQTLLHHASRNTSPQTGTCSTAPPIPGRGPVHWPVPGPCRPAAPPGQCVQCRLQWPASLASWEERNVRNLAVSPWLVAYWPPARHRPANRGLVWGVGGWLDVSVRDRAWQSFGRSVGLSRWVMDDGSQPGRGLESEGWGWLECRRQGAGGFVESTCMVGWLIDDG